MTRLSTTLAWAACGAAFAVVFSAVALLLPAEWGGYNAWNDPHLITHNVAAILTRVVILAFVGAACGSAWNRKRRFRRRAKNDRGVLARLERGHHFGG
jgi:Na+/H+ antiporter NhaC